MNDTNIVIPDPEVSSIRPRKRYSAAFKLRILAEAETAVGPGEVAAMLRREGLYSSALSAFREQRAKGNLTGSASRAGAPSTRGETLVRKFAALERENRQLRRDLSRATIVIDVQKKVSELLGISLLDEEDDPQSP